MKWLIFYQTPYDNVCYQTSNMAEPSLMGYKEFVTFIANMSLVDWNNLKAELDRFSTVSVDLIKKTWKVEKSYEKGEATTDEFIEIRDRREKEKLEDTTKGLINKLRTNTKTLLKDLKALGKKNKNVGKINILR